MVPTDDVDRAILRALLADARRPYRRIAGDVGVSGPTVSDRVDRLARDGVVRGITAELDRSHLTTGPAVLVRLRTTGDVDARSDLAAQPEVERVYETADGLFYVEAHLKDRSPRTVLADALPLSAVDDYDVELLEDSLRCTTVPGEHAAVEDSAEVQPAETVGNPGQ